MKYKLLTRLIASSLATVMLAELFPVEVIAEELNNRCTETEISLENSEGTESVESASVVGELPELREESVKHFLLDGGTQVAVQYGAPVHYLNSDGSWEEIDNTLEFSDEGFSAYTATLEEENSASEAAAYFSENGSIVKSFAANLDAGYLFWESNEDTFILFSLIDCSQTDVSDIEDTFTTEPIEAEEAVEDPSEILEFPLGNSEIEEAALSTPDDTEQVPVTETEYSVYAEPVEADIYNPVSTLDESTADFNSLTEPQLISSSICYSEVYPGVDLQYENYGYAIKESIVVNSLQESYQYSFLLEADNLCAEMQEDQSIIFRRISDQAEMFVIPAPYMEDAAGACSSDVRYTLTMVEDGTYRLDVEADASWINSTDRQLPVAIDPSLEISSGSASGDISSTYVIQGAPSHAQSGWRNLYVGYSSSSDGKMMEIYLHVNSLPSLPANCVVIGSYLGYYCPYSGGYGYTYTTNALKTLNLEAHELTPSTTVSNYRTWIQKLTWNTKPAYSSTVLDYATASDSAENSYLTWNITSAAQKWYADSADNKGIAIVPEQNSAYSSSKAAVAVLYGYGKTYSSKFYVYYRNTVGLEDYYTYRTESVDSAGDIYIGDFSQQMTLVHDDLDWTAVVNAFTLNHVYNTAISGCQFTNNSAAGIHTADFSGMLMGGGWKLSAQQTVVPYTINNVKYLIYNDADGTEHYFQYSSTDSAYLDEDGLGLKIKESTSSGNAIYTMTDTDAYHTWIFHNGYLSELSDSNGNTLYFAYNNAYSNSSSSWKPTASATNRLVQIVSHPKDGSAVVLATFSYSNNYLSKITDYANRETTFTYSADSVKKLIQITYPTGQVVQYNYDSSIHSMTMAYDGESRYGLTFTYWNGSYGDHPIYQIQEFSINAQNETIYANAFHCYHNSRQMSSYRFYGPDQTRDTADDTLAYYSFDFQGKTINVCERDVNRNILGVSMADYTTNTGTSANNNRLVSAAALGVENSNLLLNSGMENGSSDWISTAPGIGIVASAVRGSYTVTINGSTVTVNPRTGSYMLKMYMQEAPAQAGNSIGMVHDAWLSAGVKYTFSGYLNTQAMYQAEDGGGVFLCVRDSAGNYIAKSEVIDYSTSAEIDNGWEKASVTFTVPAGGIYQIGAVMDRACLIAACDDLQLEVSDTASTTSLLQNGSFEHSYMNSWTNSGNAVQTTADAIEGSTSITMTGKPSEERRVMQTVPLNCPANNTFILSGWGKANSVYCPSNKEDSSSKRIFGFIATFNYSDGTSEPHTIQFNSDNTDWQYVSQALVPKQSDKTLTSLTISAAYDYNANTAYFDHIVLAKEPVSTYTYDKDGNLVDAKNGKSAKTAYEYYSGTHLLKSYTNAANVTTELTYQDTTHNVLTATSGGVRVTNGYNTSGEVTSSKTQDSSGSGVYLQTGAVYSGDRSQVASATDANGITTSYAYDNNRLVSQTTPTATLSYQYADNCDLLKTTSIDGVIAVTNNYSCGFISNVMRKSSRNGSDTYQRFNFGLDSFGNTTQISVQSSASSDSWASSPVMLTAYTYDPAVNNGNLASVNYGNGNSVSYTYDNFSRVTAETYSDGSALHYLYNSDGDLSEQYVTDSSGTITEKYSYSYDSLGRLIRSRQSDGTNMVQRTQHIYDTADRLTSQSWQLGNTAYTESFAYDSNGNLVGFTPGVGNKLTYDYDSINRLSKVSGGAYTKTLAYRGISGEQTSLNVSQINYTYGSNSAAFIYEYDASGNISSEKRGANNVAVSYQYDQQNQLISAGDHPSDLYYSYTYDSAGNLLTASASGLYHTSGNFRHTYGYDNTSWQDLLTSYDGQAIAYEGQSYNASTGTVSGSVVSGNPISYYNGTRWTFGWQKGNQLASAAKTGTHISYGYDLNGIRNSKTVNSTTYHYITQNGLVVRQTWGTSTIDFIYDNNSAPYAMVYNGTIYYYILNQQGDVIQLIDESGTVAATYRYDPWGRVTGATGTMASINPLRYRGYYYDTESKLYYLNSRYYDPAICRFINADQAEYAELSAGSVEDTNLFAYCGNDPVNRVDDSGEIWHIVAGAVFGAVISGILAVTEGASGAEVANAVVSGAISGGLSATGVGILGQAVGNAIISAGSEIVSQCTSSRSIRKVNWARVAYVGTVGAVSGALGGKGSGTKNISQLGRKSLTKTYKSVKHGAKTSTYRAVTSGGKRFAKSMKTYWRYTKRTYKNLYNPKTIIEDTISEYITNKVSSINWTSRLR